MNSSEEPVGLEAPGRILVVDDTMITVQLAAAILRDAEHEVETAMSGAAALEACRARPPELLLLDYSMPDMNGLEVCEQLKSDPKTADLPIIMVTAESSASIAEACLTAGAADYVRKPFAPKELLARVSTHLKVSRSARSLATWKRSVSQDLRMAGVLQRSLASAPPLLDPLLRAYALYQPSLHVGGDFLDLFRLEDRFIFYVGDVAGHGVAASLVSSLLKFELNNIIRSYPEGSLHEYCNSLHAALQNRIDDPTVYATLLMVALEADGRTISVMRCGHPAPLFLGGDVPIDELMDKGGAPVGFPISTPFRQEQVVSWSLPPDTQFLLYTDGLLEALHSESGEEFGEERLVATWEASGGELDALLKGLEDQGYVLDDDCSLLEVSMIGPECVLHEAQVPCSGETMEDVAREIEVLCQSVGVGTLVSDRMQVVLLEHGGNLIQHSGLTAEDLVTVQILQHDEWMEILVIDQGPPWPVPLKRPPLMPVDPLAESGRGLAMVHMLVDDWQIHQSSGRNAVLYQFRLAPASSSTS